jgi:hypothetical protein
MRHNDQQLQEVLTRIAHLASEAVNGDERYEGSNGHSHEDEATSGRAHYCQPKSLPRRLLVAAAETARRINPVNAPVVFGRSAMFAAGSGVTVQRLAVDTARYWGKQPRQLTVSFMEPTEAALRDRILSHMNAWNTCVSFVYTGGVGNVRISRGAGGYYSYLGTDILHIPPGHQTMNLEGFTMQTSEKEYRRVVRHETGHTLGFPHEHMRKALVKRIDPEKAYRWFFDQYRWDKQTVDQQVLTSLSEKSIMGTPADQDSIMCYQLPGQITRDGEPIRGGDDINASDFAFAGEIYPRVSAATASAHSCPDHGADDEEGWPAEEDVEVTVFS